MIRNSYGGFKKWMFPGGGINKEEAPEAAAIREVKEEVDLDIQAVKKIGEYTSEKEYKKDTVFVFVGDSMSKEFKIDPNEIAEAKWFDLNNLPDISEYSKQMLLMWQK